MAMKNALLIILVFISVLSSKCDEPIPIFPNTLYTISNMTVNQEINLIFNNTEYFGKKVNSIHFRFSKNFEEKINITIFDESKILIANYTDVDTFVNTF